jgi:two-component system alkaline phosphatase synthesis response regulator PhoP
LTLKSSILIVEDDDSVRKSLVRMLAARGFHAFGARDANEALTLALQHLPAVVIMDLHLPLVPGNEAVRKLREQAQLASTAVIALSATPEDAAPGLFDEVLPKPCTSEALIAAITGLANAKPRRHDVKGIPR